MAKKITYLVLFSVFQFSFSQKNLSELLQKHNSNSVPYISVDSLAKEGNTFVLLDSREQKEYKVSHLKNALHVGYDYFNMDSVQRKIPNKKAKIIVYCSLGIRSEDIAEKLKEAGYSDVSNLYGGIFEWKNKDFETFNSQEKETDSIHTFNKAWSKWLTKGTKVYD